MKYVSLQAPRLVLQHVRIIDGTGGAPLEDRDLSIVDGKIAAMTAATDSVVPGQKALDLRGYTVMPGIVGMHDHLYNIAHPNLTADWKGEAPLLLPQMSFSAPRLYLAAGVTTLRTTGSVEPYADLGLKRMIDAGAVPGPHMDVTGPYLEGPNSYFVQMYPLKDAADARATVAFWADRGVTSFKAYMTLTRAELKAAIDEAHKRHLKVTGHLCSITYPEAVALGIDNLEHGFFVNTQLDPGKTLDQCSESEGEATLAKMQPGGPEARELITSLVAHHVAVTSTLPVFESWGAPARPPRRQAVLDAMSPEARGAYLLRRERPISSQPPADAAGAVLFDREMQLEREFVAEGGLLIAGSDPTGDGGVLPGFGDQREIELLVQAGFSTLQAIRIATLNGATYLGEDSRIGSIASGKNADLVVVKGDPSIRIADIENVEWVFKDGVGYDSKKLFESVNGRYGQY